MNTQVCVGLIKGFLTLNEVQRSLWAHVESHMFSMIRSYCLMGQVRLVHQSDMPGAVKGKQCSLPAVRQPGASVWEHRKCA